MTSKQIEAVIKDVLGDMVSSMAIRLSPNTLKKVASSEAMPGWWNIGRRRDWFLTLECGHAVIRRAAKPPARVRCEACLGDNRIGMVSSIVPLEGRIAVYLHFNRSLKFSEIHKLTAEIHHTEDILLHTGTGHSHPSITIVLDK